jgi:hypothetical protein
MVTVLERTPVLGIASDAALSSLTVEELERLWTEMLRNRDYPCVVKLVERKLEVETKSEIRLLSVYDELKSRGRDPLRA